MQQQLLEPEQVRPAAPMQRHGSPAAPGMDVWRGRVQDAAAVGIFDDIAYAESDQWGTCAVGRRIGLRPTIMDGENDAVSRWLQKNHPFLRAAGCGFTRAVCDDDPAGAAKWLGRIDGYCAHNTVSVPDRFL